MARIDERLLHVDRHGAIAIPAVLWVVMLFLARYWIVVFVVFASSRRSPETVRLLGQDFSWFMLALELPALAMLLAGWNRRPEGRAVWRFLWRHGRTILMAMAAVHIATAALALLASGAWRRWPELFLASCALLDLAVIYALAKDDYFRQLFADFPAPAAAQAGAAP